MSFKSKKHAMLLLLLDFIIANPVIQDYNAYGHSKVNIKKKISLRDCTSAELRSSDYTAGLHCIWTYVEEFQKEESQSNRLFISRLT